NWSTGSLPGPADDVVINLANGNVTVTHGTGTDAIHSLTSNAAVTLSGGSLSIATTAQVSNTFTLSGGTLAGATVASVTTLKGTFNGGTLSNVTLQGNLDLTGAANVYATVTGPLTLNGGSVTLGGGSGNYGVLRFNDTAASLTGTGSVF